MPLELPDIDCHECPSCNYNLTGVPTRPQELPTCPECGLRITRQMLEPKTQSIRSICKSYSILVLLPGLLVPPIVLIFFFLQTPYSETIGRAFIPLFFLASICWLPAAYIYTGYRAYEKNKQPRHGLSTLLLFAFALPGVVVYTFAAAIINVLLHGGV